MTLCTRCALAELEFSGNFIFFKPRYRVNIKLHQRLLVRYELVDDGPLYQCSECFAIYDYFMHRKIIHGHRYDNDVNVIFTTYTKEQMNMTEMLKKEYVSSILPDTEFHDYFCKIMKEESHRNCQCFKTKIEKSL
jgi:hypothetical protein